MHILAHTHTSLHVLLEKAVLPPPIFRSQLIHYSAQFYVPIAAVTLGQAYDGRRYGERVHSALASRGWSTAVGL